MDWNWQQKDWPEFQYDPGRLEASEATFLKQGGMLLGTFKHLKPADENELIAEAATSEAITTSAIEGEILDRQSVRSSILRHLGIRTEQRPRRPREEGIAHLMADLLQKGTEKLSHEKLWEWHRSLMQGQTNIESIGSYRTHPEAMQIVSGPIGSQIVHFEAPPSDLVPSEMDRFINWFNSSEKKMRSIARSGIAHLYFESIHPFEDGNGRIGRAIAEKALMQGLEQSSLSMLATEIESRQKEYYQELERASRGLQVDEWLQWWANATLGAQRRAQAWIDFLIAKTKLLDRLRSTINERQEKALMRMFREGPGGFTGGLSSGKYQTITGATPATAGRDLMQLVSLGALRKTGSGKGTRYWLTL